MGEESGVDARGVDAGRSHVVALALCCGVGLCAPGYRVEFAVCEMASVALRRGCGCRDLTVYCLTAFRV